MAISTSVFCTQKQHIIFSANPTCIFIVGYNNLAFCSFERCTYTPLFRAENCIIYNFGALQCPTI